MLDRKGHRLVAYALHDGFRSALKDLGEVLPWLNNQMIYGCLEDGFIRIFEMFLRNDNHNFDRYEFQDIIRNRTPVRELDKRLKDWKTL